MQRPAAHAEEVGTLHRERSASAGWCAHPLSVIEVTTAVGHAVMLAFRVLAVSKSGFCAQGHRPPSEPGETGRCGGADGPPVA